MKKLGLLSLVSAIWPGAVFGHAGMEEVLTTAPSLALNGSNSEAGIIDMHCHPSLKMYLWNMKIWKKHHPVPGPNIFHMQIDQERLNAGYVKGLLATHYLPEIGIEKNSDVLSLFYPFLKLVDPALPGKLENDDYSNFTQINEMINLLESQLHTANLKSQQRGTKCKEIVIARSYHEFKSAIDEGKIPVAHAIEGAHALGRNIALSKKHKHHHTNNRMFADASKGNVAEKYIENLLALKARGVCLMALIHFFPNDLIPFPTEGISPDEKKSEGFKFSYGPP